jgi:hypothetical protein
MAKLYRTETVFRLSDIDWGNRKIRESTWSMALYATPNYAAIEHDVWSELESAMGPLEEVTLSSITDVDVRVPRRWSLGEKTVKATRFLITKTTRQGLTAELPDEQTHQETAMALGSIVTRATQELQLVPEVSPALTQALQEELSQADNPAKVIPLNTDHLLNNGYMEL